MFWHVRRALEQAWCDSVIYSLYDALRDDLRELVTGEPVPLPEEERLAIEEHYGRFLSEESCDDAGVRAARARTDKEVPKIARERLRTGRLVAVEDESGEVRRVSRPGQSATPGGL